MTNTIGQVSSSYSPSNVSSQGSTASSSTSEIISSFKEIMSTMMVAGGGGQSMSSGIGEMMMPLMMLVLLDRLVEGQLGLGDSASAEGTSQAGTSVNQDPQPEPSGRPVEGGWLSQSYHNGHIGLDIAVPTGTPVKTTMDGKVIHAGWNTQGYGNLVIVENGAYKTYYAHLSSIPVEVGDTVSAGSTIGISGNTGNSTGPHLHYEIRKNGAPINPTSVTLS